MPLRQPLTILFIAAPGRAGGLESVVLELASGLRQLGHRTALAAVLDRGAAVHNPVTLRAAQLGIEVYPIIVPFRAYLLEYRRLRSAIKEICPDVVHTHGYRADLIGGLAARRSGVPWVSTVHGFTGGDRKNRVYEWLQVKSYWWAQAAIAVSRPIRELLARRRVPIDRVHVIPNAWAEKPRLPRDQARERLGLSGSDPVIGWVGRLSREKGADLFLEALALLPHRRWRASIVGDGRERQALEMQAGRLGIAERVSWGGLIPEAAGLYTAFDVWALTSRTEGTPIALFESIAARVPIVAAEVGGVPGVVSSAEAILVPPENPQAVANALESVLTEAGVASRRAEAAYRRLTAEFALRPWLDAHIALYRTLTTNGSPGTL